MYELYVFLEDWDYELINSFRNGFLGQWKAASLTQNWVNFLPMAEQMREDVSYVIHIISTKKGPCRSSQASYGKSVIYISVKQDHWIPSQRACNSRVSCQKGPTCHAYRIPSQYGNRFYVTTSSCGITHPCPRCFYVMTSSCGITHPCPRCFYVMTSSCGITHPCPRCFFVMTSSCGITHPCPRCFYVMISSCGITHPCPRCFYVMISSCGITHPCPRCFYVMTSSCGITHPCPRCFYVMTSSCGIRTQNSLDKCLLSTNSSILLPW